MKEGDSSRTSEPLSVKAFCTITEFTTERNGCHVSESGSHVKWKDGSVCFHSSLFLWTLSRLLFSYLMYIGAWWRQQIWLAVRQHRCEQLHLQSPWNKTLFLQRSPLENESKYYKVENCKSKTLSPLVELLHIIHTGAFLSRGPGTSKSFGPCDPGSPLRWSPVSRPAGPCSPGSQQRWSPRKKRCCSPARRARLGTGLGSLPSRAQWWG